MSFEIQPKLVDLFPQHENQSSSERCVLKDLNPLLLITSARAFQQIKYHESDSNNTTNLSVYVSTALHIQRNSEHSAINRRGTKKTFQRSQYSLLNTQLQLNVLFCHKYLIHVKYFTKLAFMT